MLEEGLSVSQTVKRDLSLEGGAGSNLHRRKLTVELVFVRRILGFALLLWLLLIERLFRVGGSITDWDLFLVLVLWFLLTGCRF